MSTTGLLRASPKRAAQCLEEDSLHVLNLKELRQDMVRYFSAFSKIYQSPCLVAGRRSGLEVLEVMILTFVEGTSSYFTSQVRNA